MRYVFLAPTVPPLLIQHTPVMLWHWSTTKICVIIWHHFAICTMSLMAESKFHFDIMKTLKSVNNKNVWSSLKAQCFWHIQNYLIIPFNQILNVKSLILFFQILRYPISLWHGAGWCGAGGTGTMCCHLWIRSGNNNSNTWCQIMVCRVW